MASNRRHGRARRILARLDRWDVALFDRAAKSHSPLSDRILPRLSRAADHSRLWMAVSLLLALAGGRRGRRAALRGMSSLAVTSFLVNAPGKWLTRRPRPALDRVPEARRLARFPKTTSFPSGHSASAAAFATGAAVEMPLLGVPLGALAASVGYSRVHTGVHYPGDVAAGFAIGAGVASASRAWWPVTPGPAGPSSAPAIGLDPSPGGRGLTIAVNSSAGPALAPGPSRRLDELLPSARLEEIDPGTGEDLTKVLEEALAGGNSIGVSGGDGSINCAAQIAWREKVPLAIVPGGTLNHLARDLGLEGPEDTAAAVEAGAAVEIDVASIDGRVFLNTASIGAYTALVDAREKLEKKIGKWPALIVALWKVLRDEEPVELTIDGRRRTVWMVFVGNGAYEPAGFAPAWRPDLADGKLDVRIIDGAQPYSRTKLLISTLLGTVSRSKVYERWCAEEVEITSYEGSLRLAHDGETFDGSSTFTIRKLERPLVVFAGTRDPGNG